MEEAQSIERTRAAEFRAFYLTNWFLVLCAAAFLGLLWMTYQWRILQLQHQFEVTLAVRVSERTQDSTRTSRHSAAKLPGVLLRMHIASQLLRERPTEASRSEQHHGIGVECDHRGPGRNSGITLFHGGK